jgi:outer membrane protein TolC
MKPVLTFTALLLLAGLASAQQEQRDTRLRDVPILHGDMPLLGTLFSRHDVKIGELPRKLDEMLATALNRNPEIQLARARYEEARAQVQDATLRVTQAVIDLYHQREILESRLGQAAINLDRVTMLARNSSVSDADVRLAEQQIVEAKATLAQLDAHARYILGQGVTAEHPAPHPAPGLSYTSAALRPVRFSADLTALLERKVRFDLLDFDVTTLAETLREWKIPTVVDVEALDDGQEHRGSLGHFEDLSIGAGLQAISDTQPHWVFVGRDYGILITSPERARKLNAPTIPGDIPLDR